MPIPSAGSETKHSPTQRGRRRRDQFLASTVDYLLSDGLDNFSLRQVAKLAGTSHRMLLYHFGSSAQLLREATRTQRPW
jgi:AcrR family transcriptional regulator